MIIENDEEHALALEAVADLMDHPLTDREGNWLSIVALAIDVYERAHYPIADPTPEEAAAFRRAEGGPICARVGHSPFPTMPDLIVCVRCGKKLEP